MKSGRKASEMPSDKKCVEILNGYSKGGKYTIENALPLIRYLQEMVNISDEEYNIREEKEIRNNESENTCREKSGYLLSG